MPHSTPIGEHLRAVRKRRGLTQSALATASGVSLSLIRKLEQGELQTTRMETARNLAVALRVPTTHLIARDTGTGAHLATDPWRPLQRAIEEPPQSPDTDPDMDGIGALLGGEIRNAYFDRRMADLSLLLAPLLREADALGDDPAARGTRAHLLQIAGSTLTQARQYPAAETALRRALDDAPDRLRAASIITTWAWLLVRQGRLDESRQLATRWADDVEPRLSRATPEDLAAWGWLLLQGSAASLRDNRTGEAEDMMRLARAAAVRTGRELPRGSMRLASWGPVTVAYKAAERDIIMDRPDSVLEMAERLDGAGQGGTEYHRHRLDVAKAHVMKRQYGHAVQVLDGVLREAPEWLSQQRYASDIMAEVIGRRRTLTPQMRALADAVNVPL
jgi:transcriptional regulator with XRE-family HTH domain